jgi:integrator complex subunit 11
VLFATPGMLQGGTSLEVFKAWAPDPKNLVLLPSYQVGKHCSSEALLSDSNAVESTAVGLNTGRYLHI